VVSVAVDPSTVTIANRKTSAVAVHVHNAGSKNITYISGMLTVTSAGVMPVQSRCSWGILERYVFARRPGLEVEPNLMEMDPCLKGH